MTIEKQTLSLAESLQELKRIDKIVEQKRAVITRYCSKKKGSKDEVVGQKKYVKEAYQSAQDLLTRYRDIKIAMQKANLEASFKFNGFTYTISEALLYKQYLKLQYELLYNSFTPENGLRQLNEYRNVVNFTQLKPEQLDAINMIPELFYDEKKMQKHKEDLLGLMTSMDALIDKTNHNTTITVG